MSRASEAGSPKNRSGSDKTQGKGSFGPSTGGPDLQGSLQPAELTKTPQDIYLDKKNLKKETDHTFDSPFLLRQGEPGTSQYTHLNL